MLKWNRLEHSAYIKLVYTPLSKGDFQQHEN